jgi:hypothetical protein
MPEKWGKQNTICKKCKKPSTQTWETSYDDFVDGRYCIRYFERLCAVCLYWSAWIWLDNGREKVTIDAYV